MLASGRPFTDKGFGKTELAILYIMNSMINIKIYFNNLKQKLYKNIIYYY